MLFAVAALAAKCAQAAHHHSISMVCKAHTMKRQAAHHHSINMLCKTHTMQRLTTSSLSASSTPCIRLTMYPARE